MTVGGDENEDIDAYYTSEDGSDRLLFKLRVRAMSETAVRQGFDALEEMARKSANNNRGVASGVVDIENIIQYVRLFPVQTKPRMNI